MNKTILCVFPDNLSAQIAADTVKSTCSGVVGTVFSGDIPEVMPMSFSSAESSAQVFPVTPLEETAVSVNVTCDKASCHQVMNMLARMGASSVKILK